MKYIRKYNENIDWIFEEEEEEIKDWVKVNIDHKFNNGDIVKIREDSEFYTQAKEIKGKIIENTTSNWYEVLFDNGYENNYRPEDLYLLKEEEIKDWVKVNIDHKFNNGDIVKIREDSEFYTQAKEIKGKIIENTTSNWYEVLFDNGYENNYRPEDLYLLNKNNEI